MNSRVDRSALAVRKRPAAEDRSITSAAEPVGGQPARVEAGLSRLPWLHTRTAAVLLLLALYSVLSFSFDPAAYLSTDVGGKTATVAAMEARGDWQPDVGYWFEADDPDGGLHPLANTTQSPDGLWINTTSLTTILPARPVWTLGEASGIGGSRLLLVFPMAGAIAAALAAGELERRTRRLSGRDPGDGHRSRWLIGLASPLVVYALDFWEHALGLAAMGWAMVAVAAALEAARTPATSYRSWHAGVLPAGLAGLGFGVAATMRQEAMVYGFVAALVIGYAWLVPALPRVPVARLLRTTALGVAMAVGFVVPMLAHFAAEIALTGGTLRASRAVGTAGSSGSDLADRLLAVLATTTFPFNGNHPISYAVGLGLAVGLTWWAVDATRAAASPDAPGSVGTRAMVDGTATSRPAVRPLMLARAFALAAAAVLLVFGLRFVPGLVPTTPLAIAGLVAGWRRGARWIVALAVVPLPLVFAVQFPQGALAQWGGRYLLCTGFLLIVSAVAVLGDEDWRRPAGQMFVAMAVGGLLITAFGVTWRVHRADGMLSDWAALDEATGFVEGETSDGGPVVVWGNSHGAREAGPLALERRWLAALLPDERADLSRALVGAEIDSFYYVWLGDAEPPAVPGFDSVSEVGHLEFQNNDVWRYERSVAAES